MCDTDHGWKEVINCKINNRMGYKDDLIFLT
jgi:hypothetical protein